MGEPSFAAGRNIAMKVPPSQYEATVAFYRDVLGFPLIDEFAPSIVFEFGSNDGTLLRHFKDLGGGCTATAVDSP